MSESPGKRIPRRSPDLTVLKTKLNKPGLSSSYVLRLPLIAQLTENLHLPLTLVSAPTGYGKSVLLSQWLDETQVRYGWLSLDEEHNDIQVLLAYLVTLLENQWPQVQFDLGYLRGAIDLPPSVIAKTLIKDLDQLPDQFVLILDDYHLIKEPKVHEIINYILKCPSDHFHLVIVTQTEPPLKLGRLRAQLRLNEIRTNDLVFTTEEAFALCAQILGKIPYEHVKAIVAQSEGWVAAITIGIMGLKEEEKVGAVLQAMRSDHSAISQLLEEVVLDLLPVAFQKYLEMTALLDRFSADLVAAMIEAIEDVDFSEFGSKEFIQELRQRNLFCIPLDHEWYRYHHLFRSLLQNRVGRCLHDQDIVALYKAASTWFEKNQLLEEGLRYAILSQDMDFAVRMFDRHRQELHNTEQLQRLERLIQQFPPEFIDQCLGLLISLAILQDHRVNFSAMAKYLSRAEQLFESHASQDAKYWKLKGQFHGVSAYLSFMSRDFQMSIKHAERALELLPAEQSDFFREFALAYYCFSLQAIGKETVALELLQKVISGPAAHSRYFKMRVHQISILIHSISGNIKGMASEGLNLYRMCSPDTYPGPWSASIYNLACSSYLTNDLKEVNKFHEELFSYRYVVRPFWVIHHFIVECLSFIAQDDWENVDLYLGQCRELSAELAIAPLEGLVSAFEVEVALIRDDIPRAVKISASTNFEPHPPIFYYYIPQLTQVKLYLRTNRQPEGLALLNSIIAIGREHHNENLLFQALALQAVTLMDEGQHEQGFQSLREALSFSMRKGNIRTFVDLGPIMEHMIRKINKDQTKNEHVEEILQAFWRELQNKGTDEEKSNTDYMKELGILSKRELEILTYVARGFKNDEIADRIFVSPRTVKKHLYRAYKKLNVSNRVSAIKKAQELGFISPD